MKRFPPIFVAAAVAACGPQEPAPEPGAGVVDSPMVVASEPGVPSDSLPAVVFLGTSLTAGLGLEQDADTYVSRLREMGDSAGLPFRAINAGVSGETSAGGLRRLDWVLRQPVDVLVVELGANDGLRGQDPFALSNNLTQIIRRSRTRYPAIRVILAGMEAPPNLGAAYTATFRAVFVAVAESEDTELIPFLLDRVAGVPGLNQGDRIHPTPEGHRMVAENAWPVLQQVLDELDGGLR